MLQLPHKGRQIDTDTDGCYANQRGPCAAAASAAAGCSSHGQGLYCLGQAADVAASSFELSMVS